MRNLCATVLTVLFACTSAFPALVAHWDFGDQTYDDQVGSLNGTVSGTASIVAAGNDHFDYALQTTASANNANYLNIGNLGSLGIYSNSFTLSYWVKTDQATVDAGSGEVWESYSGNSSEGYEGIVSVFRKSSQSNVGKIYTVVAENGTTSTKLLNNGVLTDDQWHWIVIWYNGDTDEIKYFEDGVHIAYRDETRIATLATQDERDARLGDGFGGLIGDVRIYDEALSFMTDGSGQLSSGALYDLYAATGLESLVAHWDFSDGTYNDKVGDLDGTANGTVSIIDSGTPYFLKAVQTGTSFGSDYLNLGDLGTLGIYTNSFTVSLWINREAGDVSTEFWDSQNGTSTTGYEGFTGTLRATNVVNAGKIYLSMGGGGEIYKPLLNGEDVADGDWHWVVIRYDGNTDELKYFEDGLYNEDEDEVSVCSLVQEEGRDLWIGDGFGGMIGDVRIYSSALSFTVDGSNMLNGGDIYGIYTGSESAATNFTGWVNQYPTLGTSTNYLDDPDADGLNNLLEYAFGGVPTDSDATGLEPISMMDEAGLLYTYRRRTDAAARQLDYSVLSGAELSLDAITNATEEVGSAAIDADFEVVTNRVPLDAVKAFVTLKVQASE